MSTINPFIWFDHQAEEAMNLYISIFKDSKVLTVQRQPGGGPGPVGSVLIADFEINGLHVTALNGGPAHPLTEAFSLVVSCQTQEEVDEYWEKLTADGGEEGVCGWLKDKFGLSWQIVPEALPRLMGDPSPAKAGAVMQAMMKMKKINVAELQAAYDGA